MESLDLFQRAIEKYPNLPRAYGGKAECFLEMEKFDDAIVQLERVLQLVPEHIPSMERIAACHFALGDEVESLRWYDRVVRYGPRFAGGLRGRGLIHLKKGDLHLADQDFQDCVRLFIESAGEPLADSCIKDVIPALPTVPDSEGHFRAAVLALGHISAAQREIQRATEFFSFALDLERLPPETPGNSQQEFDALIGLAASQYLNRNFENAAQTFSRGVEIVQSTLSQVPEEKQRALERGIAGILARRGSCFFELGKFQEAFADSERAISIDASSEDKLAYLIRGNCHFHFSRWREAIHDFETNLSVTNHLHPSMIGHVDDLPSVKKQQAQIHVNCAKCCREVFVEEYELFAARSTSTSGHGKLEALVEEATKTTREMSNELNAENRPKGGLDFLKREIFHRLEALKLEETEINHKIHLEDALKAYQIAHSVLS